MVVAIVEGMFEEKECRKHQLTIDIITMFGLQTRVNIVREELLWWFNISTAQRESRVHLLNLAALAVNKIHASAGRYRSTYDACTFKYEIVHPFSCLREVFNLHI